jgi:hypothetical protein
MDESHERMETCLDDAARLVLSAGNGRISVGDRIDCLARAKEFLGGLGASDRTPACIATELLATRDELGALLLGVGILDEVGVAESRTGDLLSRGSDRCYQRLQTLAELETLPRVDQPVS